MFGLSKLESSLILTLLLAVVIVGWTWYEQHAGAAGCLQSVQKTNAATEVKEEKQHSADTETVHHEGATYALQIAAPILPAPIIRLCPELHVAPLQASAAPGPEPDAKAADRGEDPQRATTWDSTPVVQAGRDANAQIAGLEDYILKVCRPK